MSSMQGVGDGSSANITSAARKKIDQKTKPLGSLGQLESLAVQLATIQQTLKPVIDPVRIVVFAADHGVSEEGVSAFPAEVTAQMMENFATCGAAVSVLGQCAGAGIEVVDVGVNGDLNAMDGIVHCKIAMGSANLNKGPAMTHEQLDAAMQAGREAVVRAVDAGVRCVGLGEMGIANTTSAAILTAMMCNASAVDVTGRGTGVDDARLLLKQQVVDAALANLAGEADDPMECLRRAGGLEIAALVGAIMEAPAHRMPIVIDGFIVTAAALIACRARPSVRDVMVFAHQSAEVGHAVALKQLEARPLLQLDMRLGEGSASALAIPLLRAATAILNNMASFEDAGVSTAGTV